VEQNIVSVERILHQTEETPEAPEHILDAQPEDWPSEGQVEFKLVLTVTMRTRQQVTNAVVGLILCAIDPN
jgi:hypothetical protein